MPLCFFNHPLLFAAAAVLALGVVVYEIVSNQEEKKNQYRGRNNRRRLSSSPDPFTNHRRPPSPPSDRRRPPSPPSDRRRPPLPPSDPSTDRKRPPSPADSFTSCKSKSPSPPSDSSVRRRIVQRSNSPDHSPPLESYSPENNLIKHNDDKTSPKKSFSADLINVKSEDATGSAVHVKEQTQTSSDGQNIDDKVFDEKNYTQNIFDKFTDDTKHINQNLTKENNLVSSEEESDSSENNNLPKSEVKVINQSISDKNAHTCSRKRCKKCLDKPNQGPTASSSDSQSDISENDLPLGTQKKYTKKHNCQAKVRKTTKDCSASQSSCMQIEADSDSISSVKSAISSSSSSISEKDTNGDLKKKKVHINKRKNPKCLNSSEEKIENEITGSNSCKAHEASSSQSACICSATLKSRSCSSSSISDEDSNNKEEACEAQNPKSLENVEKDKLPKSEKCEACLKENINASFSPCNHSYLCTDCVVKFSRISKKCSKCYEDIKTVQFVPS